MIRSLTKKYYVLVSTTIVLIYLLYISRNDVTSENYFKEGMIRSLTKKYYVLVSVTIVLIYLLYISKNDVSSENYFKEKIYPIINQNFTYLINTSQCRIAESNPYNKEIVDFLKEEKYTNCSQKHLLTYIKKSKDVVTLNVNRSLLRDYSIFPIKCFYSNITRVDYEKSVDNKIGYTHAVYFEESVKIKFPYIVVKCYTLLGLVYANAHATTFAIARKVRSFTRPKYSILLIGIDSMSKSNLRRTMTKTYEYVTAYAEDDCRIVTYNYDRPGFSNEPTDFYYHPYFLAAEDISITRRDAMTYCAGPETSGERIMNAAKDFSITFRNAPYFGLFWTNSFSHDNINLPAVMDYPMFNLLSDPEFVSSLNNTILIFLSDHGFRFGDIRNTHTGWFEERLPFIYIRVPQTFKLAYPEKYNNLLINSHRLTTPYDLFNTFQDILQMGNDSYRSTRSKGCAGCQSLFLEIKENRTCKDASIQEHWCTCSRSEHNYIDADQPNVKFVSEFIVSEVNSIIKSFNASTMCLEYSLNKIKFAKVSEPYLNGDRESAQNFLILVETNPTAIFEATVATVFHKHRFKLLGEVSRTDRYEGVSGCVKKSSTLKKYCYCPSIM